ncbi:NifB/NifX family molybdenum-iron cluster-binding protein [Halioxenophilus sp. WMMB6]|uniref:NifB/NifX family molybdenum-iron cluster-binding protein n=1 Tax=Halioxenophilus sp. WMMB6 TaxID=3073815 RepID=UPI00295EF5FA|nr:NifB/NifX family molybdenum-iron cluster-binding protein [Halioxenophilus sp. WMMB6]
MNTLAEISCVADLQPEDAAPNGKLTVAFASQDGEMVDQHFGSAQGFFVYEIDGDEAELIASKIFPKELKDGNEDKLKPKLQWLLGCDLVYCGSVGGSATKQLVTIGVNPVVVKEGPDVEEIIEELQAELNGEPSPMLKRILAKKAPKSDDRFDDMEDEDWEE